MYRDRKAIWLETIVITLIYAAIVWQVELRLAHRIAHTALRLAAAFALVQCAAILLMLAALTARRGVAERRARRSAAIRQEVHDAVAQHASGVDRLRLLRGLQRRSRRDVAAGIASFLAATRGSMHERVSALSRDLGVSAGELTSEGIVERSAEATLYDRALLADETMARADVIAAHDIPRALAMGGEQRSIAALDLLLAWQRGLAVQGLEHALGHPSEQVRARAYAAIPYVQPSHAARIADGLRDASPAVRRAAAEAAGKLRASEARGALMAALHDPDADVAVAAAFALAALPDGVNSLQECIAASEGRAAYFAFEALEKAAIGRLENA